MTNTQAVLREIARQREVAGKATKGPWRNCHDISVEATDGTDVTFLSETGNLNDHNDAEEITLAANSHAALLEIGRAHV